MPYTDEDEKEFKVCEEPGSVFVGVVGELVEGRGPLPGPEVLLHGVELMLREDVAPHSSPNRWGFERIVNLALFLEMGGFQGLMGCPSCW